MQIFISYSRVDRALTDRFVRRLRRMFPGDTVWYDEELQYGDVWWEAILDQIAACDIFVYLLSNESVNSPYCLAEFTEAQRLQKRIVTVQVRDRTKLPPALSDIQYVEMKSGIDDPDAVANISRAINYQRVRVPKRPLPPLSKQRTPRPEQHDEVPLVSREEVDTPTLPAVHVPQPAPKSPIPTSGNRLMTGALLIVLVLLGIIALNTFRSNSPTATPTTSGSTQAAQNPTQTESGAPTAPPTTPTVTLTPSITPTVDFVAAAQTFDALGTSAAKATNLAATGQFVSGQTATATLWTKAPTPTLTLTPNITASFQVFLTQRAAQNATATATLWTKTPTATFTPTLSPEQKAATPVTKNADWTPFARDFDGVTMVLVPAGCFTMGTENPPSSSYDNEKPTTRICFDRPFWIDKTDVTQAQFTRFGGKAAKARAFAGDNRPVENITWFESRDFCAERGARLPTEAEWEYATRGPDNLVYPWGNTFIGENAVNRANSNNQTADVGSKPAGASWVGALDMSGNVWQWVNTLYKLYPYNKDDGRESNDNTNSDRVRRGSSWTDGASDVLRSAIRFNAIPSYEDGSGGFRCARSQ